MENQKRPITTLVAVDLDGTLLTSEKKVSEKTKDAIRELKEHGILFGIVSGRPVESGLILCEGWGIQDSISFLIGMNGGVLYDVRRKEKETYSIIPGHTIWKIIEAYHEMPTLHFEVMVGNKRYVQYSTPETIANAKLYGEEEIIVDLEAFLENHNVNKLVIRSTAQEQPRVKEIGDQIKIPGVIGFSTSDILYEFVDPDINKGYGLYKVCDHFGLNLKNVVAFGDENNDVQMLMTAGTGVAMKNALPGVKAICDVVSEYTNDEDAIAHYINEVILPEQQEKVER